MQILLASSRCVSTWKLAAGGLQRKWKGIKQRTAWRFKTLKDKNTLIVFTADGQKEKEIRINVRAFCIIVVLLLCVLRLTLHTCMYLRIV